MDFSSSSMMVKVTTTKTNTNIIVALVVVILVITTGGGGRGALGFKCSKEGATCNGLVGYSPSNLTTLSQIQSMFGVPTLHSLLGANNLSLTTPSSYKVLANHTVRIPFRCRCSGGKGMPLQRLPIYTVVKDDGLWHIAAEVFSGVVTYQQIQDANNITDANKILFGQELWIPLPCSCDELIMFDGQQEHVIHYGHVVKPGSTIDEIAQQYGTTNTTLLALNDLPSPKSLFANTPLDVPLKACTSMVETDSLDYPLLVGDGTYAFTAGDCVMCKCDAASTSNSTLQCEPSSIIVGNSSLSSMWKTCPSMQCQGGDLYLGNTTTSTSSDSSSSSSCNVTTCSYAGYSNQTILTTLSSHSTCAVSNKNRASKVSVQGWSWGSLLVSINLMVLCLHVV